MHSCFPQYTDPKTNTTSTLNYALKIKVGGNGISAKTFVDNEEVRLAAFAKLLTWSRPHSCM